eukprot:gene3946-4911_t
MEGIVRIIAQLIGALQVHLHGFEKPLVEHYRGVSVRSVSALSPQRPSSAKNDNGGGKICRTTTILERSRAIFSLKEVLARSKSSCDVMPSLDAIEPGRIQLRAATGSVWTTARRAREPSSDLQTERPAMEVLRRVYSKGTEERRRRVTSDMDTTRKQRLQSDSLPDIENMWSRSHTLERALGVQDGPLNFFSEDSTPERSGPELWAALRKRYASRRFKDDASTKRLCALCGIAIVPLRMAVPMDHLRRYSKGKREALPLERMLGTALVLAAMAARKLLSDEELKRQMTLAAAQPWRHPPGRGFLWYLMVFKQMIPMNLGSQGWYNRVRLWNLVLLQHADGSFTADGTGDLATALHAGDPQENPGTSLRMRFSDEAVATSAPPELLEAFGCPPETPLELECRALQVWATILAVTHYRLLPFTWCHNPNADPDQRRFLSDDAEEWLAKQAQSQPEVQERLQILWVRGEETVELWGAKHRIRLCDAKDSRVPSKHHVVRPLLRHRMAGKMTRLARLMYYTHPVLGLHHVGFWEPFSRSERLILMTTNWVLIIAFSVGMFYSKAMLCCSELKEYAGCESHSTKGGGETCYLENRAKGFTVSYATCGDLFKAENDNALDPDSDTDFTCTAFPQGTLVDSFFLLLMSCALVMPIRIVITTIFTIGGSQPVPANWGVNTEALKASLGAP